MDKSEAIKFVRRQYEEFLTLEGEGSSLTRWRRDTGVVLEEVFGPASDQRTEFGGISFHSGVISARELRQMQLDEEAWKRGCSRMKAFLESLLWELETFGVRGGTARRAARSIESLLELCSRFHAVARQLRRRHGNRPSLEVNDEYDVQDLLHGLLKIEFRDVRPESWTPNYGGTSARSDFFLPECGVVVEVKMMRASLSAKDLGDQLIVDTTRYAAYQGCSKLVCFVYDPDCRLANPAALENDLSGQKGALDVRVVIHPKA